MQVINKQLYEQIKVILNSYTFNEQSNFYKLFKYAKASGLKSVSFHQFTNHAKNMGVISSVARVDGVAKRSLTYLPVSDTYIKKIYSDVTTCHTCKGSGVVKVRLY